MFFEAGVKVEQASFFALRQSQKCGARASLQRVTPANIPAKRYFARCCAEHPVLCVKKKTAMMLLTGTTPSFHMCRNCAWPVRFQTIPPYYAFSSAQQ